LACWYFLAPECVETFSLRVEMNAFDTLVIWRISRGSFYFVARSLESNGPDVSRADGDYGTRFLAAAGVLICWRRCTRTKRREDVKRERRYSVFA